MLLQTNSYVVPKDQRAAHARLLEEFIATLARLGCDLFEVYEQVGSNWDVRQSGGRFVQIMRFRDREHQLEVQAAEREDAEAQKLISRFCELINFPYQQEHGYFAVGFYTSLDPAEGDEAVAIGPSAGFTPVMRLASDDPEGAEGQGKSRPDAGQSGKTVVTRRHPDDVFGEKPVAEADAVGSVRPGDAGELGHLVDATVVENDLDVALPAELLDEEGAQEGHPPTDDLDDEDAGYPVRRSSGD